MLSESAPRRDASLSLMTGNGGEDLWWGRKEANIYLPQKSAQPLEAGHSPARTLEKKGRKKEGEANRRHGEQKRERADLLNHIQNK